MDKKYIIQNIFLQTVRIIILKQELQCHSRLACGTYKNTEVDLLIPHKADFRQRYYEKGGTLQNKRKIKQ